MRKLLLFALLLLLPSRIFAQAGAGAQVGAGGSSSSNASVAVINVKSAPYNAFGDTQQIITTNAGQHAVNPGTEQCPSVLPGGAPQCVRIFANDYSGTAPFKTDGSENGKQLYSNNAGIASYPRGSITGVFNGTGGNAGNQYIAYTATIVTGCAGNCSIVWGHDDQAAMKAAAIAINGANGNCQNIDQVQFTQNPPCQVLYFPPGGYMSTGGGTANPGLTITGNPILGAGTDYTSFYLSNDYNAGTLAANGGLFIQGMGNGGGNFSLTTSGMSLNFPNTLITVNCSECTVHQIKVAASGNQQGNAQVNYIGTHMVIENPIVTDPATSNLIPLCGFGFAGSISADVYGIYCANNPGTVANMVVTGIAGGSSGTRLAFHGGQIDECNVPVAPVGCTQVINSKDVYFLGTNLLGGSGASGTAGLAIDGTSEVTVATGNVGPFGANSGSGISVASGGKLWFSEVHFRCNSSAVVATCLLNNNTAGSGNVVDVGGNSFAVTGNASQYGASTDTSVFTLGTNARSQLGAQQVVSGNVPTGCTITGNGTSTCAFDTGSTDAAGRITITAAGTTTAVGLVSYTYSRTYGTNSSTCSANYLSGTGTWAIGAVAPIYITATTAGASFNINNAGTNLTATSTYKVNYTCYGQ